MILGIGVDILHLPRLAALIARRANAREIFACRILSLDEIAEFHNVIDRRASSSTVDMYLATRWAAKEAVFKAMYPRHRLTWKEVTVTKCDGGQTTSPHP
ncbi:hypothetical protein BC937DRAFT_89213 [Endogone sp. FLAS-F59071]|nr:hypothetical protein BC937DRAFT_89213 [Endogone sp. FLAS-F59071]|eukprot:RUS18024.1 hypothetical protein BC937DRAFT_89213 [Endogone sp. FLAS-F59071]